MKRLQRKFSSIILAGMFTVVAASAAEFPQPEEVRILPGSVFTPSGFDDNDNVQIVIDGVFPDTCYRAGPSKVKVNHELRTILVEDSTYAYQGELCMMMLVPYVKTIHLGVVDAGSYSIQFLDQNRKPKDLGKIQITKSNSANADEFLYAPIEEIFILNRNEKKRPVLVMRGHYPNHCMALKSVSVNHNVADVLEVLPMAEYTPIDGCKEERIPFEHRVELKEVPQGKYLIHVRALNGQSVNLVVNP